MNSFKTVLRTNRLFFLTLLLVSIAALCLNDRLSIPLHAVHPVWLNIFFINYSFMGDGVFVITLALFYYFYLEQKRTSGFFLFSFLFSEMIVQLIKNFFSNASFHLFFEKGQYLFFTDEADLVNIHSFPSGHTAVAFAIVTVLIVTIKNKKWVLPLFFAAVLLGISRMYLAQHSMAELVAGAFIGTVSGLFVYCLAGNGRAIKNWFTKIHRIEHNPPAATNIHPL